VENINTNDIKMLDICVNTIVRNGEDTIGFCLDSVLSQVKRAIVTIDDRCSDRTPEILDQLARKYRNLEIDYFEIKNPKTDLIRMRNAQLKRTNEKYVWIVDSDEYYPLLDIELKKNVYAFQCWAVWNRTHTHKSSSKAIIPRIFRNKNIRWTGTFGKEKLTDKKPILLPIRYVHFTHLKEDNWRKEMNQNRVADGKFLSPLPEDIKVIVNNFYEAREKM
ncbi:MAG: glycosyltransferase, partial [Nanoarchaeota archaeon]